MTYGNPPQNLGTFDFAWDELMHYLYLPVVMQGVSLGHNLRVPRRLDFLEPLIRDICDSEEIWDPYTFVARKYVYVTARRGYATPGNPLNRPGWHSDGFGSDDINYIWSDRWPTRFAIGEFDDISDDHVRSAEQFEQQIEYAQKVSGVDADGRRLPLVQVVDGEPNTLYRLDPSVIHATPIIDAPGGERSFFKISVSPDRYNLRGNSHNYLFDYSWRMWSREEVRNDPAYAGGDAGPQEVAA